MCPTFWGHYKGLKEYGLGELFPKYAEFWGGFVFLRRDPTDTSKLRADTPVEIEDIFNNHYYVFYQLTLTFRQIGRLSDNVLDVGDPLYHLATTVDLIERTFVAAYRVNSNLDGIP